MKPSKLCAFCSIIVIFFFTGCVTGYKVLYNEGKSTVVLNGVVPVGLKVFENGEEIPIQERAGSLQKINEDQTSTTYAVSSYQKYLLLDYSVDHTLTLQSGGKTTEVKMSAQPEWLWFWLSGLWIIVDYYTGAVNEFPDLSVPASFYAK
ncbi:MAG: hypothetical protein Q8L88_05805 [Bacteroidota bacterium]|nr:hypothetical protein [Bacteroidota bacterium]